MTPITFVVRPSMRKRTALSLSLFGLAAIGFACFAAMLIASLRPTEATVLSHRMEIDLKNLAPGEWLRVDWERYEVFVIHRMPEQIAWLESYTPPVLSEWAVTPLPKGIPDNRFRSIDPRYLVVAAGRYRSDYMLWENRHAVFICSGFHYTPLPISTPNKQVIPGGFYCGDEGTLQHPAFYTGWTYDVAGRSSSTWISPLQIPPHRLEGQTLVLEFLQ